MATASNDTVAVLPVATDEGETACHIAVGNSPTKAAPLEVAAMSMPVVAANGKAAPPKTGKSADTGKKHAVTGTDEVPSSTGAANGKPASVQRSGGAFAIVRSRFLPPALVNFNLTRYVDAVASAYTKPVRVEWETDLHCSALHIRCSI